MAKLILRRMLLPSAALALMSACSLPPPILVLYEAAGPEDIWSVGQRLHPARTDSLTFLTGFVEYSRRITPDGSLFGTPMTFFVMARNTSPDAVILDPLRFRLRYPDGRTFEAVDPEEEIRNAARDMVEEHKRHAEAEYAAAVADLSFALLDLVTLPFTAGDQEQMERDRTFRRQLSEDRREADRKHAEVLWMTGTRRDQWARNALRKTTLPPGMSILGSVSLAQDTTRAYPDTVILEYRMGASDIVELGRYGKVADSLSSSAAARTPTASDPGPARSPSAPTQGPARSSTPWTRGAL